MAIYISGITLEVANCDKELSLENIEKAIRVARQSNQGYLNVALIGDEPLSHSNFLKMLDVLKKNKCNYAAITTDGSLLKEEHLTALSKFQHVIFYIMLESIHKSRNDRIKNRAGAFEAGETALQMISEMQLQNVSCLIKMMIREETINEMKDMIIFAQTRRCDGIILSPEIICFDSRNFVSKECFRNLLEKICDLQKKYSSRNFFVSTAEPLMRIMDAKGFPCTAGISSFHMDINGRINPCYFLQIPLDVSSPESYKNNGFIQAMLMLNKTLKGKCGKCSSNNCIGCRARAFNWSGDFLGEDPYCWM